MSIKNNIDAIGIISYNIKMNLAQNKTQPTPVIASEAKQFTKPQKESGLPCVSNAIGMTKTHSVDSLAGVLKFTTELGKCHLLENKRNRQKQWTPEKRRRQATLINDNKPWLKSTGTKTATGKAVSSKNNYKHGFRSADYREILRLLRMQRGFVRQISRDTHEKIREMRAIHANKRAMDKKVISIEQKSRQIKQFLGEEGVSVSLREVKQMVKAATGYGEEDFITRPDTPLSTEQNQMLDEMTSRRALREPLYRILGMREFWGLEFEVTPDTLDPRPDTETLVEVALKFAKNHPKTLSSIADETPLSGKSVSAIKKAGFCFLDLGTGTGCIPISLLSELPQATAVAVDISTAALDVARRNRQKHGLENRLVLAQGDWFNGLEGQKFDLIVSNPPYISEADITNLEQEVRNHDPKLALSGGDSGLEAYKKIIFGLKNHLNIGGKAYFEIGIGQLESLKGLVEDSGLIFCDSYADLSGIPRVVEIYRGDK